MSFNIELLKTTQICASDKNVHLPNEGVVNIPHTGSCEVLNDHTIRNVLYILNFRYNLMSVFRITKDLNCLLKFLLDS